MNFLFVIFIAFALAMDAFAVSIAVAAYLGRVTLRQKFRLSFHFGLFQFLMPLIGWLAGSQAVHYIEAYDHWIALFLLSVIGVKMILDARHAELKKFSRDVTRGFTLISLAVATSIDALAVGFSMGVIKDDIFWPAVIIGLVAAGMTWLGIKLGCYLSTRLGQRVSIAGGIILILIGLHIVLDHLSII